jgi:hypothetical protein
MDEESHNAKRIESNKVMTRVASVKEEHLDVIMYHPQKVVKLEKIVSRRNINSKGAYLALENEISCDKEDLKVIPFTK